MAGPLEGIKVIDFGQYIAGPLCAMMLADQGAEVLHIDPPGGPRMRTPANATWNRGKRCLELDLAQARDQEMAQAWLAQADVLIENFRPGALEGWGLSPELLMASNPRLIVLRISGYGQTGPYRNRPGFGVIGEAMGGLRHLTAEPGRVPVRVGVSIGDTLSALHGVIGILLALQHRHATGQGQVIDVALYEAVFNCMESLLPEYSAFGAVREPAGSALPGIAPTNAYLCQDGAYALVAGNGDSIFKRLMALIERPDLANDPALADNTGRVARVEELDAAISAWTAQRPVAQVLEALDRAAVPAGRIYTVADIAADPHYQARGMLQNITLDDGSAMTVPGIVPKLSLTPGQHRRLAPQLGQDTDQVLTEMGLSAEQIQTLKARGIVGAPA